MSQGGSDICQLTGGEINAVKTEVIRRLATNLLFSIENSKGRN